MVEFIITLFALVPLFLMGKKDANGDFTGQVVAILSSDLNPVIFLHANVEHAI